MFVSLTLWYRHLNLNTSLFNVIFPKDVAQISRGTVILECGELQCRAHVAGGRCWAVSRSVAEMKTFFFFFFREKEKKKLKHWLGNALFLEILFRAVNPLNLVWLNGSRQWSATIKLWRVHNCPKVWTIHLTNSNLDSSALVWMVVHCVLVFRSYIQLVICSHYRWLSERSLEVT